MLQIFLVKREENDMIASHLLLCFQDVLNYNTNTLIYVYKTVEYLILQMNDMASFDFNTKNWCRIWDVTSLYPSLCLRDSGALYSVS